jgi:hypothetical protein
MTEQDEKKVLNGNDELAEDVEQLKEVMHDDKKKPGMLTEGS